MYSGRNLVLPVSFKDLKLPKKNFKFASPFIFKSLNCVCLFKRFSLSLSLSLSIRFTPRCSAVFILYLLQFCNS